MFNRRLIGRGWREHVVRVSTEQSRTQSFTPSAAQWTSVELTASNDQPTSAEPNALLERTLKYVRWITVLILLLFSFAHPLVGRVGVVTWILILLFAGYSGALTILRRYVPLLQSSANVSLLDLAVAATLYALGASPTGPLFVLLLLMTVCAAATCSSQMSLLYTSSVILIIGIVSRSLPLWSPNTTDVRSLFACLIIVALASSITALLARQLEHAHQTAHASRQHAERQAELDQLRSAFYANMSHDLRTPLTALRAGIGMLETSLHDRIRPDEEQLLATARRNSERLSLLISDLITAGQLDAGVVHLELGILDVQTVVAAAVSAVRPLLAEKHQRVTIDLPECTLIHVDLRRLEQALINVLANAFQHTPDGTHIEVSSRVQAEEVILTVSDDGPGIPAEEVERIFVRFHRLTPATGGSGLGLSIARSIIEAHGGRIWAESEYGHGTAIFIALPRYEH